MSGPFAMVTAMRVSQFSLPVLALAVTGLALTGCASEGADAAAAAPEPAATSAVAVDEEVTVGEPVSGVGSTDFPGDPFPIPADARSLELAFECDGDWFTVEIGDSMMLGQAPLSGPCDGSGPALRWPIVPNTGQTIYVGVGEGVSWSATPWFSTAEFAYDEALTADCAAYSDVSSGLHNADIGLDRGVYDDAEWEARTGDGMAGLASLADASESSLAEAFTRLHAQLDTEWAPGMIDRAGDLPWEIQMACRFNHTEVVMTGGFGG